MITQPHNVTGCVGRTVMFTFVMEFQNVSISIEDVKWWRRRIDDASNISLLVDTKGNNLFSITSNIINETLTSVLMITELRSGFTGPYWLEVADGAQMIMSAVAFLSIGPSGMTLLCVYMCTIHVCIFVGVHVQ